ncbi:MAG TPA: LuxR C-terminal-related transcriptional regulator [Flavobacterium sp.]|jgi:DNA-binding CsgD family transcriptional regulator
MLPEIQTLHTVWSSNRTSKSTPSKQISFDGLTNSIISTGPFNYYIIDFFDMSLSHSSPSLYEMHGLDPDTTTLNNILGLIHPDDIGFVVKAEAFLTRFFYEKIGREKMLSYKMSYNFRCRVKSGEYVLFNHQALMLTMDDNGGYGKSLNIHTRIDHLGSSCNYKISLIGLSGEPSFMNLSLDGKGRQGNEFSKREVDIIKLISEGLNNNKIAEKLFLSVLTVKTHRKNILAKSGTKNTAQLIKNCILQGII